jgi:hypothetical protein
MPQGYEGRPSPGNHHSEIFQAVADLGCDLTLRSLAEAAIQRDAEQPHDNASASADQRAFLPASILALRDTVSGDGPKREHCERGDAAKGHKCDRATHSGALTPSETQLRPTAIRVDAARFARTLRSR